MARINLWMQSWPAVILSLVWLAVLAALHWWPTSYWFDVRHVVVHEDLTMTVDRTINKPFHASWSAITRRWDGDGWTIACTAQGAGDYLVTAKLPKKLNLAWWTNGQCAKLDSGRYMLTTTWVIDSLGIMPNKSLRVESNVFEVP